MRLSSGGTVSQKQVLRSAYTEEHLHSLTDTLALGHTAVARLDVTVTSYTALEVAFSSLIRHAARKAGLAPK
jgi:hypothetical protein